MKKYTLTISILASNRKDTLPKTLESIKPILDNVSSELIVADTGCDEDLLEIIRKYTDKIEKFTWCTDFSKARNTIVAAVILVSALGLSAGITFSIGSASITLTGLAIASLAGIILNAIFPEKDFDPAKAFEATDSAQINLESDYGKKKEK